MAKDLVRIKSPKVRKDGASPMAIALGALLNPSCFASARVVAKFAINALARQREEQRLCIEGVIVQDGGSARGMIERWLGIGIPPPVPVTWHLASLEQASSPMVIRKEGRDGQLGVSKFDPFKFDQRERKWRPKRSIHA